tara:strand:- start:49 stop:306 length:258 start_codon:yes stop_codon:yes gene_type:complete
MFAPYDKEKWKSLKKRRIKLFLTDMGARNLWEILYLNNPFEVERGAKLNTRLKKARTGLINDLSRQYHFQTKADIDYLEDHEVYD